VKQSRGNHKTQEGIVQTKSGSKTIKVLVTERRKHKLYNKILNYSKSYLVDDPNEQANVGDKVQISFTRPISKLKRWRMTKVLEKAVQIESVEV